MAGRGLREEKDGYFNLNDEDMLAKMNPPTVNVKYLIKKIDEISMTCIDPVLYEAENMFKSLCINQESMKDIMLNLHCKALSDPKFGEKYVMVLGQVSNYVVDDIPLRSEVLTFIENDFKIKDTMFQSDTTKFLNAVMLLGNVYNIIKIQDVPLKVLGGPMLEYMNLLLEGKEDHHRVFAIQILLNGEKIIKTESLANKYELLKQSTRKTLITSDLSSKSKCWILLALDFMINDMKPLNEELINFYLDCLGNDKSHVYSLLKPPFGPGNVGEASGRSDSSNRESDDVFKDIENLAIPPEMLNVSAKLKPSRFHRPAFNLRLKNSKGKELKNPNEPGNADNSTVTYDEDDIYGIQIERDSQKGSGKRK